jgi:integrase
MEYSHEFGMFIRLSAATGARRGEICALRWSDVDFDGSTIRIARAVVHGDDGSPVVKSTKTGNTRTVTLDPGTVGLLRAYRTERAEQALGIGVRIEDGFIFSHEADSSAPIRPDYVTRTFGRVREEQGLRHVRLHDLRHHHATALLNAGVDLATVAGRLGHADGGRTTLTIYAHFMQPADRVAADIIGAVLQRATVTNPPDRRIS